MRRILLWLSSLALLFLPLSATLASDPWVGKSKDDLVALLGEPDKTRERDGRTELTYKLVRLEDRALPPVGMRTLSVPGIAGTVGTMTPSAAMAEADVGIHPTELDRQGRAQSGSLESEESYSVSWGSKDKKVERSWEDRRSVRGKLTLKFELNASGTIEGWSASPKKAVTRSD